MRSAALALIATAMPLVGNAADPIGDDHEINWATDSGVSNGIPNYTVVHSTLSAGATVAQINTALANAGAAASAANPKVVKLNAGTYNLSGTIEIEDDYVLLRGSGMSNTILNFSSVSRNCMVYVGRNEYSDFNDENGASGPPSHLATWWTGHTRGTTTIKVSNVTGLSVGMLMGLDQFEDLNLVENTGNESPQGGFHTRELGDRGQLQIVQVTGISGTNVTFYPALYPTNFATANTPQAWWLNGDHTKFSGIESLRLNAGSSGSQQGVHFKNAGNCWAYNVRSEDNSEGQFVSRMGFRNTVKHCIAYGADGGVGSYGISAVMTTGLRIEDNISEKIGPTYLQGSGSMGTVFFANYQTNAFYTGSSGEWLVEGTGTHGTHCQYHLYEANHVYNAFFDFIRGSGSDNTLFRSRVIGRGWNSSKPGLTTIDNVVVTIQSTNYWYNIIGNVLGDNSFHTVYQYTNATSGSYSEAVFVIGYFTTSLSLGHDPKVPLRMNRAYNYDTVSDAIVAGGLIAGDVPASLLYPSGPPLTNHDGSSYWGNRRWPAFDPASPDASLGATEKHYTNIPAGYWHHFGSNTPPAAAGGTTVTNLHIIGNAFKVTGTGGLKILDQ